MWVHVTSGARRASFALLAVASAACTSAEGRDGGPTAVVPAIRVVAAAAPVALAPGASAQAAVTVTRAGGYRGAVTLAVAGAPSGVTASLSPATLGDDDTERVLSVRAAADAAPGRYDLAVTGRGPGVHAVAATLFGEVDEAGGGARLQLAADGRFEEERLTHYTAWAQLGAPGETRTALAGGRGRYTVERNTLALRYDGGRGARC
jgi:hypothetical protein